MSLLTVLTDAVNSKNLESKHLNQNSNNHSKESKQNDQDGQTNDLTVYAAQSQAPDQNTDAFTQHFQAENTLLTSQSIKDLKEHNITSSTKQVGVFDKLTQSNLNSTISQQESLKPNYNPKLIEKLVSESFPPQNPQSSIAHNILSLVGTYQDLFHSRVQLDQHETIRTCLSMHCMNHVIRTRQRVLKNNEKIAHSPDSTSDFERRDQGFTRPKILIIAPFRNSALAWFEHLKQNSLAETMESEDRFRKEFGLPEEAIDKLADPDAHEKFPKDHISTFKGNIDDEFRVGLRITRKSIKAYTEFYSSDIIIASPLGLRVSIEKTEEADFLSSIEVVVADQLDVMAMQNWEHVQFVFRHLNLIPQSPHDTDFSRLKPYYSDAQAGHLRQSILLSRYDLPEIRALYNSQLVNVAGKSRTLNFYNGMVSKIPRGIKQVFQRFTSSDLEQEEDERFEYFKNYAFPTFIRTAPEPNRTIVLVPSYFDFVRVKNYFNSLPDISYGAISEYSPNSDVSRARTKFYTGEISYLIITERFHFFKRYKIRGAKSHFFYSPPDHSFYYPEIIQWPLQEEGQEKSHDEIFSYMIFSKYDFLRLERIVGTQDARRMVKGSNGSGSQGSKFSYT